MCSIAQCLAVPVYMASTDSNVLQAPECMPTQSAAKGLPVWSGVANCIGDSLEPAACCLLARLPEGVTGYRVLSRFR